MLRMTYNLHPEKPYPDIQQAHPNHRNDHKTKKNIYLGSILRRSTIELFEPLDYRHSNKPGNENSHYVFK